MLEKPIFKIVRHAGVPCYHIDDQIGVALMVNAITQAGLLFEIVDVHPSDVEVINKVVKNESIACIDVGRSYDVTLMNFDHHHDENLDCAAVLVAKFLSYSNFVNSDAATFMTIKDTKGISAAVRITGYETGALYMFENVLRYVDVRDIDVAKAWTDVISSCQVFTQYGRLIEDLFNATPEAELKAAKRKLHEEETLNDQIMEEAQCFMYSGLKVFVSQKPVNYGIFNRKNGDIVIAPEKNFNQISIYKIGRQQHRVDLSKACFELKYIHNSGFCCGIEKPTFIGWEFDFVKSICIDSQSPLSEEESESKTL